ncbi:570_t:CDS:2, partial [Acaulospora colombiana]
MADTDNGTPIKLADTNYQESSQVTDIIEEQTAAPATPFEALQIHLQNDPYDTVAWQDLINIAEDSEDPHLIHTAYDSLLKVYPNTVQAQLAYLRHSQAVHPIGKPKVSDQDIMPTPQTLFSLWLKQSPEAQYCIVSSNQASPRDVIKKAFEFALRFIGQDREAGEIWKEYIEYIKADPTSNERESQEKMDLLRSVYRRAVQIPLDNLEQIWREWDAFENSLNKLTECYRFTIQASLALSRLIWRVQSNLIKILVRITRPSPDTMLVGKEIPRGSPLELQAPPVLRSEERSLLASWRKYLEFEESNPLDIQEKSMLNARLLAIYRKATIYMRFYPEIWHLAYLWCISNGKADDAFSFLKGGLEANPTSFLLNFSFNEHQEQALITLQTTPGSDPKKMEEKKVEGHDQYKKFIGLLRKELDEIEERHISEGGTPVSQHPAGTTAQSTAARAATPLNVEDDIAMKENEIYGIIDPAVAEAKEREREREEENKRREMILIDKRIELGQVGIAWMRYAKRVGQSAGMRNVFKEIRADKWVCWQVFEAAAILEHQISPTADVAAKIFELGLRFFSTDVDYVVRYLNFLINKCDEASEKSKANLAKMAHLSDEFLTNWIDRAMKLFAQRYMYLGGEVVTPPAGIDAIASHDLQTPLRPPSVVQGPQLMPAPTPLVPQNSPPTANASDGTMPTYPHPYHPPSASTPPVSATALPKGPPARIASPLVPPKRPLPEAETSSNLKRMR